MKMDNNNRLDEALSHWLEKERRLNELAGRHITNKRHYLYEKVRYYRSVLNQYKNKELTNDERITRNIIKGEVRDMERLLYPNLMERVLRRALRQAAKVIVALNIPAKVQSIAERVLTPNRSETATNQSYRHPQSENLEQTQTKRQDLQLSSNVVATQKNEGPLQAKVRPIRNVIMDTPVRSINRNNDNTLKNGFEGNDLSKKRHRHRLS
jgi:hypothetical protein